MVGGEPAANRTRRPHTRSRFGCLSCKKRHVRCDERQPACTACMSIAWRCIYPPSPNAVQNLSNKTRTLAALPPRPTASVDKVPIDPFDSLPIKMSKRSLELWQRYTHVDPFLTRDTRNREIQYLSLSRADPSVCHILILLAAVHSTESLDALGEFKVAFLDHKIQVIEMVNAWLADPHLKYSPQCIRVVSTLCLIEACFGDRTAAKVHNEGLVQLLSMRKKYFRSVDRDEDVLHRFIFVVQIIIHCILYDPRCKFQDEDPYCRQYKLDLLRLVPYLLDAGEKQSQPTDAEPVQFGCLGPLAAKTHGHIDAMDGIHLLEGLSPAPAGGMLEFIWTFARLHVFSLGDTVDIGMRSHCQLHPVPGLSTTWSCLVNVTFSYCSLVMRWSNNNLFPEEQVAELLEVGVNNVEKTRTAMLAGTCDRDVWFWEAFASVVVLTRARRSFHRLSQSLQDREMSLYRDIKTWSQIMGVNTWEDAKKVLQKVVWHYNGPEEIARATWERIIPPLPYPRPPAV